MTETIVYTDGSCLGNPGKGGWAAVIIKNNQEEIIFGSEKNSTNNRMELTAAINAINNWKNNNWKNANKKDVKNKDLWTKLDSLINKKQISWEWVKAHSINEYNNKVDILARKAASAND
ncbi:MAG: ribonuclease HI [Candidatus Fonsibacter ubiquis]|nr:ribonuclease HI [Candidatus Fonsibacter ubiquis]